MVTETGPSPAIWVHLGLRIASIAALFVSLGFTIYCTKTFGDNIYAPLLIEPAPSIPLLLAINIPVLLKLCSILAGITHIFRRAEVVCLILVDLVGIILAAIGGVSLIIGQYRGECGTRDCAAARRDASEHSRLVAGYSLVGVAATSFLQACMFQTSRRLHSSTYHSVPVCLGHWLAKGGPEVILGFRRKSFLHSCSESLRADIYGAGFGRSCRAICVSKTPKRSNRKIGGKNRCARHLRALLQGVQTAGVRLQSIRTGALPCDILDIRQFRLHSISDLLDSLTAFEINVVMDWSNHNRDFEMFDGETATKLGTLHTILAAMPSLTKLRLGFRSEDDEEPWVWREVASQRGLGT
ncbi:hypothetical protein QBC34DRAFT_464760 [Podospora aff. communis PSN243]|uniref:MARVEL domain-containing protein n=1 Tax=Podospora aff. communis PSN243 TaxID=3040156 RepID=A0AAV9H4R0_9PEZI|nr:hypothetical protein QBC34DRAFT_464760 [Podospora aff. communis PSN243]